ncbi:hypothetical protein M2262_002428 [Pseudomonas sp. BIGb0408]|nr:MULTISPECIES: hypothetical protein [Pseudomonas]MCW2292378.1 hypothetical protein [Pseudomonas sp. BIGb0408]
MSYMLHAMLENGEKIPSHSKKKTENTMATAKGRENKTSFLYTATNASI